MHAHAQRECHPAIVPQHNLHARLIPSLSGLPRKHVQVDIKFKNSSDCCHSILADRGHHECKYATSYRARSHAGACHSLHSKLPCGSHPTRLTKLGPPATINCYSWLLPSTSSQQCRCPEPGNYALTRPNDLIVVDNLFFIFPQRFSLAPVVRV
eukprot:GHRR01028496.1.p1 GENE.GHRR01028496.1~~GHRR01028496.1.p1  ORF type:complete len:154 (+),score=19.42 GHRR01028496.1:90-551(+)